MCWRGEKIKFARVQFPPLSAIAGHCGKGEQDPLMPNQQCFDFNGNAWRIPFIAFSSTAYVNAAEQQTFVASPILRFHVHQQENLMFILH
jgi:hypothetical protein